MATVIPPTTVSVFIGGGERARAEITDRLSRTGGMQLTNTRTPRTIAVHVTGVVDNACQLALEQLRTTSPGGRIILVADRVSTRDIAAVVPYGVAAVVLLSEANPELLASVVTTVAEGGHRIPPALRRQILDTVRHAQCPSLHGVQMSPTELEIVRLLSQGATNKAIARTTNRSLDSVKVTLHRLMTRLGTRSRAHTVAYAARHNLI
ncbi:LuxR C-terminal-related transcriptional regulator [Streptomyces sp. NPDC056237]|uniref:response regulator transcription factor n=1 Tax=unclassified Streptomyces TaxID=2593676 RepID=UPI0035D8612D